MIKDSSDLRARIVQEVEHHLTPQDVAAAVLRGLSAKEVALVAQVALVGYVRGVMNEPLRNASRQPQPERVNNSAATGKTKGSVKTYGGSGGKRFASPALAARHEWYERQLDVPLYVDGARKRFGDFTVADLGWLVRYREDQAQQHHTQAKKYQRIAELLEAEGATTVRDLDPALVEPLLNG